MYVVCYGKPYGKPNFFKTYKIYYGLRKFFDIIIKYKNTIILIFFYQHIYTHTHTHLKQKYFIIVKAS
jgi:mannose-6-phosphate isomerase-like protein (cupin superfamily)